MSEKHLTLLISTILADLIVLAGVGTAMLFAVRALNAKVRAANAPEQRDPAAIGLYLGAVLMWPMGLALGMMRLGKPETVRSARVLLFIAMGHFAFATLAAIAIVTVVAAVPPDVVLDNLP